MLASERLSCSMRGCHKSVAYVSLLLLLGFHVSLATPLPTNGTVPDTDALPTTNATNTTATTEPSPKRTTVVIVGAGMAGIKAAETLAKSGIKDVIVLEATDRVGGRVKSYKLESGHRVNMGPQTILVNLGAKWIHGKQGDGGKNPVWKLKEHCRLSTKPSDFDNRVVYVHNTGKREGRFLVTPDDLEQLNNASKKLNMSRQAIKDDFNRNPLTWKYGGN